MTRKSLKGNGQGFRADLAGQKTPWYEGHKKPPRHRQLKRVQRTCISTSGMATTTNATTPMTHSIWKDAANGKALIVPQLERENNVWGPKLHAMSLRDKGWKKLTVRRDVNLLRQSCNVHFEPVLNIIQDLRIIFFRDECDSQAFGTKTSSTCHLSISKSQVHYTHDTDI